MLRVTFQTGVEDLKGTAAKEGLLGDARSLLRLREELRAEEEMLASRRMELAREQLETERITVPAEEFRSWFEERRDAGKP